MMRRRGFTLIELLVVISIIAILMAILMPGLQRVKTQAQFTTCRSNLRNYGITGRMYSDDFDGEFPYSFTWLYKENVACAWHRRDLNLDQNPDNGRLLVAVSEGAKHPSVPDVRQRSPGRSVAATAGAPRMRSIRSTATR